MSACSSHADMITLPGSFPATYSEKHLMPSITTKLLWKPPWSAWWVAPLKHALHLKMRAVDEIPTEPRGKPDVPPCRPKDVHYDALPAQARDPALHLCIE
jgi:hypothetical protein